MGATERRIAEFIVHTAAGDIPAASFSAARASVVDAIGVALAGTTEPHGAMITDFAAREGAGSASMIGDPRTTSLTMAALANGTLVHALDYDDLGKGFGHPSSILLPTALALAEHLGASGHDLLAAYVIGFEVGRSVANGMPYRQGERGFHTTGTFGTLTSTAVACRLLGLTVDQTVMALGIAGSMPSGVIQNFGTHTKPLHAGQANRNGVTAALLARDGWLASDAILESPVGFPPAYAGIANVDVAAMTRQLGVVWDSAEGVALKRYPCCGSNHSAIDSIIGLVREHGVTPEQVVAVEIAGLPPTSHVLFYPRPAYAFQGKFSIQYSAAVALVDGAVTLDSYAEGQLARPEVRAALDKITIVTADPAAPGYEAKPAANPVTIRLTDGRVLTRATNRHTMHGSPADPLSAEELRAKFRDTAGRALPADQVERALALWSHIDGLADVGEAVAAVKPEPAGQPVG